MTDEIQMFPLAGFQTATLPERHVLLEMRFLTSPFDTPETAQSRRFGMTAPQARLLAEDLLRAAAAAEKRQDRMPGKAN